MTSEREKKCVYHLTSLDNLPAIRADGLLSRRALAGRSFVDVADADILVRRSAWDLDAMVPFHFIHRSPFDYAVIKSRPDETFALLAVNRQAARSRGWKIIARHPLAGVEPNLLEWDAGIAAVDWAQMDKKPRDYQNDHECKMVCMAEALSPKSVPIRDLACIFVASENAKRRVEEVLSGIRLYVTVNAGMFPGGAK